MIAILLGTYNGNLYLREQLDSLYKQTIQDFHIYIRDDGSADETKAIINEYAADYPNITVLNDTKGNVGSKQNFELLLSFAQADYYMFCDQDDVWLPNKIEVSLARMKQLEQQYGNIPLLVHTDLMVVDGLLNVINDSFWRYSYINPQIVDKNIYYMGISNSVTGCTILMNEKAKEVSLPFHQHVLMHDAWVALCVMKYGRIDYITEPTMKYRQHGDNVLGAIKYHFSIRDKLYSIRTVYRENKEKYLNAHPLVYKNILHYLYYKILFSYIIHCKSKVE